MQDFLESVPQSLGVTIIFSNVKICEKYSKKSLSGGIYGPQRQFSPQLKVVIFGTCTKNILMCCQVKFQPAEHHSL